MLSCIYNKYFLSGLLFILIGQFILCLDYSFFLDILYSGTRFLIFGILLIEFLKSPKASYIDKYFIYFFLVLLLTTLLNCPYRLIQFVSNFINVFCVIFLFNLCPQKSIDTLTKVLSNVFSFYIYANFILLIVYPDGLWMSANGVSQYLIGGNYNQMGLALIVGNVSNIIYSMLLRKKTINSICCFIISIATVIFLGSMTATLGLVILGLFLPFMSRNIARGLILFFLLFVVSFYFFVIYNQIDLSNNAYALYFIEDILGKNLTFTHRTFVWENAIELIKKSPILGYGLQSPDWFKYNLIYLTPHNMILLILIYGGFALLLSFIFIMISVIRKSKGYKGAYVNLLHFVLVDCLLMFSTETYQLVLIFLLFIYLGEIKLLNNVAVHNHYTA